MEKPIANTYHPPAPNFYAGRGIVVATHANLPHWNKAITASFVTFRLADSLPQEELLKRLERRGVDLGCEAERIPLPRETIGESVSRPLVEDPIQSILDAGYGSCVLKDDACRQIVEDALWHFAGERYALYAYVVMPNHVHILFQPMEGWTLSEVVMSWKRFTARKINDRLAKEGTLWQKESFDTLVRNERHFKTIVGYIKRNNPMTAWAFS